MHTRLNSINDRFVVQATEQQSLRTANKIKATRLAIVVMNRYKCFDQKKRWTITDNNEWRWFKL